MKMPGVWAVATTAMLMFGSSSADAGHGCCCPCPCTPQAAAQPAAPAPAAPDVNPPAAPQSGVTQQSQSIEPQANPVTPPVVMQPAPVYRNYSTNRRSATSHLYNPERRLHPSNRIGNF